MKMSEAGNGTSSFASCSEKDAQLKKSDPTRCGPDGSGSAAKTVPAKVEGALCSVVRYSKVTEPKPAPLEFRQQLLLALVQCTGNSPISDKMSVGGN